MGESQSGVNFVFKRFYSKPTGALSVTPWSVERRTAIEAVTAIACARAVARLDHKVRNNSAARVGILSAMAARGPNLWKTTPS
jgi:hypothetical protein